MAENSHHHVTPHQIYGRLLTHQTLILWIITYGAGVIEKEVNRHPHNTKFSSPMEAIARAMEDINEDYLMKPCSHFQTRIESVIEAKEGYIKQNQG
ncbi:hypothetical protein ACTXT7_014866 [Hymenolepis weldensis]